MAHASPPEPDWSSLPADLLRMILERLPWSSHPSFGTTCKHWGSVVSPFYPAWLTPMLLNSNAEVGTSTTRYYSPYYHKNFEIAMHLGVPNAQICCTNGHRLALSQRTDDDGGKLKIKIVDCNLVTGVVEHLDPLEREHNEFNFVIYDDGGKRVFGIDAYPGLDISRASRNNSGQWDGWMFSQLYPYGSSIFDASAVTNPVLHGGLLYILDAYGRLAVHDERQDEEGFNILDKPEGFGFDHVNHDRYLFKSDEGELMTVLIECHGSSTHLVRLNKLTMEWEKVESLEGRTLFTGALTTMMVKTDVRWMKNKIFVPRLYHWPETIHAKLVEKHGELAFVPVPTGATRQQYGPTCGSSMWTCELEAEEFSEFWETIKLDYSIWIDFKKN